MDLDVTVFTYILLWMTSIGSISTHLRLQPEGSSHAFFTEDNFFITCFASEASGATRLTWQGPTGKDITVSQGRLHVEASPHSHLGLELVFEEVKYKDSGMYTCSAVVDGTEVKTHFTLTVYHSISFIGTPLEQFPEEGDDYLVSCSVRSDPSPRVSWYINGTLLKESPRYTITGDGLYIRNVKRSDAGNYTCRAFVITKHKSQIKEVLIMVHVHYRPIWHISHMDNSFGIVGATANLTCEAHAQPPPIFEWFREQTLLGNSQRFRILNGKWKSVLHVKIKDKTVFGDYYCVVSNNIGKRKKVIPLLEGTRPSRPLVAVQSFEPGVLVVRVVPCRTDPLPVVGYKLQYKLETESWTEANIVHLLPEKEFVLPDLSFDSKYVVRVAIRNAVGYSNYSEEVTQTTRGLLAETVVDSGTWQAYPETKVIKNLTASLLVTLLLSLL